MNAFGPDHIFEEDSGRKSQCIVSALTNFCSEGAGAYKPHNELVKEKNYVT